MIPNEIEKTEYPEIFRELIEKEVIEMDYKKAFVILARKEERDMRFAEACFNFFCKGDFSYLNDDISAFQEIFFQTILFLNSSSKEEELAGKFSDSGHYKTMIERARKNVLDAKKSEPSKEA